MFIWNSLLCASLIHVKGFNNGDKQHCLWHVFVPGHLISIGCLPSSSFQSHKFLYHKLLFCLSQLSVDFANGHEITRGWPKNTLDSHPHCIVVTHFPLFTVSACLFRSKRSWKWPESSLHFYVDETLTSSPCGRSSSVWVILNLLNQRL